MAWVYNEVTRKTRKVLQRYRTIPQLRTRGSQKNLAKKNVTSTPITARVRCSLPSIFPYNMIKLITQWDDSASTHNQDNHAMGCFSQLLVRLERDARSMVH